MAEPFLSEIRIFSFDFAPKGWALCNGQLLPINQNQALFSLLGTTYGGNGQTNFALPNLQGKLPLHEGNGHVLGETAGSYAVTLNIQQLTTHAHTFSVNSCVDSAVANANAGPPTGAYWANNGKTAYSTQDNNNPINTGAMNPSCVSSVGGSQAHTNIQPFLTLNFCIALQGIFPSQN
ncbi:MAG TPA: tail fiber protein [Candidatus Binatia bacterium]|nr:tail fiber protein [Candidatus Binatia bacterium]